MLLIAVLHSFLSTHTHDRQDRGLLMSPPNIPTSLRPPAPPPPRPSMVSVMLIPAIAPLNRVRMWLKYTVSTHPCCFEQTGRRKSISTASAGAEVMVMVMMMKHPRLKTCNGAFQPGNEVRLRTDAQKIQTTRMHIQVITEH